MSGEAAVWPEVVTLAEAARGLERTLTADEAARARVAKLLGLEAVETLMATVTTRSWLDGAVVDGRFSSQLVQTCGVSLEPVPAAVAGAFTVRLLPPGSPNAPANDDIGDLDPEAEDPPDVLEDERIDLGGYVVEHLALELDPFPRAPGVEFATHSSGPEPSPFAALAAFKPRGD